MGLNQGLFEFHDVGLGLLGTLHHFILVTHRHTELNRARVPSIGNIMLRIFFCFKEKDSVRRKMGVQLFSEPSGALSLLGVHFGRSSEHGQRQP